MKAILQASLMLFLLSPSPVISEWRDMDGELLEEKDSMKSVGEFGAQLLTIGDEKEFFRRWETPSVTVQINTVSEIERGDSLITPIIFSGCAKEEKGNCNVSADYKVLYPDGRVYADMQDVEVWVDKPPPEKGQLQLSVGYLKIVIEHDDPFGSYTVLAKVTDNVAESEFTLKQKFKVSENIEKEPSADVEPAVDEKKRLGDWVTNYYRRGVGSDDLDNLMGMLEMGFFEDPGSVAPMIMFMAQVFRKNESRLEKWEGRFHEVEESRQYYLLRALWESNTDEARRVIEKWPGESMDSQIEKIQATEPYDMKTLAVNSPTVLDMLWASFLATGDTYYVERVASVITLPTTKERVEDKDQRIANILLVGAAKWSLASNAAQHESVKSACKGLLRAGDEDMRLAIREVLKDSEKYNAQQADQH